VPHKWGFREKFLHLAQFSESFVNFDSFPKGIQHVKLTTNNHSAMAITRIFDLLEDYLRQPKQDALAAKVNGKWITYSTQDFVNYAYDLASGLIHAGIKPEDKIGIIANNRPEWNFADYACQLCGAVSVPIYPTISEPDLEFIMKDAGIRLFFISSLDLYEKVKKVAAKTNPDMLLYTFDEVPVANHWKALVNEGKKNNNKTKIAEITAGIGTDDLVTILYTSGTTGNPKGVMLSHNNILSNSFASQNLAPFTREWRALSFLPLNHVYERMLNTLYIYLGVSVYYAESLETIGDNLKEVKPHVFATVPRLLEKVFDKIVAKGYELSGIKKKLFFWALDLGLRYELNGANGAWYEMQLKIARKLIFSKWQEALGGNIVAVASGGAALQPRLARVFNAAGITVLEGYGLTETSPVIAVNNFEPNSICFGTVGTVLKNTTVKIADDGEILVKGPGVMLGYYKRPDLTAEVMDQEGWLHTGDIGEFVQNRFLKITDRKKEIFKTSGGKYIAPLMIENKLKESPFIEQVMVIGENRKYPSALIVPAFAYIRDWAKKNSINIHTNADIAAHPQVMEAILRDVEKTNENLAQYERIKNPALIDKEWTIDGGEMTPKLSLKRKVIMKENEKLIERIYQQD
jgi:long-chain acyl-CoA synthetase